MITISLCMIVKNEEEVLGRCLDSAAGIVDEIIIVDTGSTDNTKHVAAVYTEKIYDFEWVDDFATARTFAFSKATMEYQLWLDADDVITPQDKEDFIALKSTLSRDTDIVMMKYHTSFDKYGNPAFSSLRERLLKRANNYRWQDPVHEFIPLSGNIVYSDIAITHKKEAAYTDRNLKIYKALETKGAAFTPRQLYYYARELKDHGLFHQSITYFNKFLETGMGWSEDNIAACFSLALLYHNINYEAKILPVLFQSFQYDSPRAEVCCQIAYYYKRMGDYQKAADWFKIAMHLDKPKTFCFLHNDYWDYIPALELCVCHYHMGNMALAKEYNQTAEKIKPEATAVISNNAFFQSLDNAEK